MGLSYRIDGPIVVFDLEGEYEVTDIRDVLIRALEDPLCPGQVLALIDLRRSVAVATRTPDDVQGAARYLAVFGRDRVKRVAFVAESNVAFGMMRVAAPFVPPTIATQVFRDVGEARRWLLEAPGVPAQ